MMYFELKWLCVWIFSFILMLFPLPDVLVSAMPSWVFLVLLYRVMVLKTPKESFWILLTGLMLDVMQYTLLGEHVFALALSLWVAKLRLRRFHTLPLNQQLIWVAMSVSLYQLILLVFSWMQRGAINMNQGITYVLSVILAALVWSWLSAFLTQWLQVLPHPNKNHRLI